jgi:hypothetical protein
MQRAAHFFLLRASAPARESIFLTQRREGAKSFDGRCAAGDL